MFLNYDNLQFNEPEDEFQPHLSYLLALDFLVTVIKFYSLEMS